MTFLGILQNLLSDVIFLFAAIIISWIFIFFTRRIPLQKFFGVSNSKRLIIYLSNISVIIFGSVGLDNKKLSYKGETVSSSEMQMANKLQSLFSFIVPRLAESIKPIGKIFLADVDVNIEISPRNINNLETQAPFISLGSPGYNAASLYIEKSCKESARFHIESMKLTEISEFRVPPSVISSSTDTNEYDPSIVLPIQPSATLLPYVGGTTIPNINNEKNYNALIIQGSTGETLGIAPAIIVDGIAPMTDTLCGFVERVIDPVSKRKLFYVASLSEHGTKSAAYFLATKWHSLYRKYKDNQSFLIMLRFDNLDFRKWTIVFERTLNS